MHNVCATYQTKCIVHDVRTEGVQGCEAHREETLESYLGGWQVDGKVVAT
jgi:hypothetical protein